MNAECLVIFDESLQLSAELKSELKSRTKVYLFPLSTDPYALKQLIDYLSKDNLSYEVLASGKFINQSAESVRSEYLAHIAHLPINSAYRGKTIKEYFALEEQASMWWLSLIAEKSTLKSDSFNVMSKYLAIVNWIGSQEITDIQIVSGDSKLKRALTDYAKRSKLNLKVIKIKMARGLRERVLDFQGVFYIKHLALLFNFMLSYAIRIGKIKRGVRSRCKIAKNAFLFITYYPVFSAVAAKEGVFENKYCRPLQQALEERGQDVQWMAISVHNDNLSLTDSLEFTEQFKAKGQHITFWEEYCSLGIQLKAFFTMLAMSFKFLRIESILKSQMNLAGEPVYSIFQDDWYSSFVGKSGYYNLLFYYSWLKVLKAYEARQIFYYCEMQCWERALILANQQQLKPAELIAYQHATVSPMLLSYFNHPDEFGHQPYALPEPNKLICNGQRPYSQMLESGWSEDKLSIAEAIRYEHLKKDMTTDSVPANVVLLALPISVQESASLLNVVYQALNSVSDVEVWIKPHPFLIIDKVFRYLKFTQQDFNFKIRQESMEELLTQVKVMIGSQSGVSFEAIAFGCEVVIINTPEQINMSPLKNTKSDLVWHADSVDHVREIILDLLAKDKDVKHSLVEAKKIIDEYFYLNQSSDQPDRLLSLLQTSN